MEAWSEKGPRVGSVPSAQMILQVKILIQRMIYFKPTTYRISPWIVMRISSPLKRPRT